MAIEFHEASNPNVHLYSVKLDKKIIGHIDYDTGKGYRYVPKAGKKWAGEYFVTVHECIRSVRGE